MKKISPTKQIENLINFLFQIIVIIPMSIILKDLSQVGNFNEVLFYFWQMHIGNYSQEVMVITSENNDVITSGQRPQVITNCGLKLFKIKSLISESHHHSITKLSFFEMVNEVNIWSWYCIGFVNGVTQIVLGGNSSCSFSICFPFEMNSNKSRISF